MNRSHRILPVYTGDVSGVCSALYELGGMVVIHDPSGCNSTYNTHDETRWYDRDSLIFISGLSEIDAILGNDEKLVDDVADAARQLHPRFIALVNSPIPYLSGVDFPALARLIEAETGIPAFYVKTNGMHDYVMGAGGALAELAARFVVPANRRSGAVNLLGVTPLDFAADGSDAALRSSLRQGGFEVLSCWAMGDTLETLSRAAEAEVNLVVSALGLPAARVLRQRFGTPYVTGLPVGGFREPLFRALRQAAVDGQNAFPCRDLRGTASGGESRWTAIGEPVTMGSIGAAIGLERGVPVQVLSPLEDTEALLAPMDFAVAGEEEAEAALAGSDVILADPLYRPVCPPDARLISLPHLAFSGRCFQKSMQILPDLDPAGLCAQEDVP